MNLILGVTLRKTDELLKRGEVVMLGHRVKDVGDLSKILDVFPILNKMLEFTKVTFRKHSDEANWTFLRRDKWIMKKFENKDSYMVTNFGFIFIPYMAIISFNKPFQSCFVHPKKPISSSCLQVCVKQSQEEDVSLTKKPINILNISQMMTSFEKDVYYFDEGIIGDKFNFKINKKIMKTSWELLQTKEAASEKLSLMIANLRETSTSSWREITDHQSQQSSEDLDSIMDFIKGFKTDFLSKNLDMTKELDDLKKEVRKLTKTSVLT
jgi:hypothetical protein